MKLVIADDFQSACDGMMGDGAVRTTPVNSTAQVASNGVAALAFNVLLRSLMGQRKLQSVLLVRRRLREEFGRSSRGSLGES